MKKTLVSLVIMMFISMTASGSVPIEEVKWCHYPISMTVMGNGDNQTVDVKAGNYFKVTLESAAGTGYRWELDNKNMVLVNAAEQNVASVDKVFLPGGKVRWEFYYKVNPTASGQETLRFSLRRCRGEIPAKEFLLTVIAR
ncbi:MAG: Chagasin family peptidase inhibitor [Firmicutes bacterium]|nr:Chagasin family peptidase inhibitor [Bacillota bacterium]